MNHASPNRDALLGALDWARQESLKPAIDSQWNQGSWITPAKSRATNLAAEAAADLFSGPYGWQQRVDFIDKVAPTLAPHCGTAFCIAGYVGQKADPRYRKTDIVNGVHVSDFAEDILGITDDEAERLFDGDNSLDDVVEAIEDILGEDLS